MKDISVIIPVYNTPLDKLEKCIESVLKLKNKCDIEVLIIDDGSKDYIKKFFKEKFIGEVVYQYKKNGGVSSARNMGLNIATGKFVCFVDADDIIVEDAFADLEKTLYYKRSNNGLLLTDNENEAVIKIVGNKTKNNAILTAINVGNKKSDVFKGFHMQYTGAALDYNSTSDGIIYETRFDYYTRCTYEFTFKYVEDIPEVKEYQVIEGANQKYTIDKDSDMTFRIDADYSLFDKKVYIDNELVDVNNYTSKEGSTIIVFNKDYVSTLNVGKHTLKVVFSDNNEALTNFEIIKEEKNEIIKNPETIDNIEKYIAIGIVAVIGIIGSTLLIRKSKEK